MSDNFVLRAITLRGIGSYLHGARLEIRPLTILCGMNGSGKSTWFKALNILKKSSEEKLFPFQWSSSDFDANDIQFTNAFMHLEADMNEYRFLEDEELYRQFGPPCTVGLEFEATRNASRSPDYDEDDDLENVINPFLLTGEYPIGTRFTIRIAHPTSAGSESIVNGFYHLAELRINDELVISFSTPDQRSDQYTLECSAGLLPGFAGVPEGTNIGVAQCNSNLSDVAPTAGIVDDELAVTIVKLGVKRIRTLVADVLSGYFYLSAIRLPHLYLSLDNEGQANHAHSLSVGNRYVGSQGENSWWLQRTYARYPMQVAEASTASQKGSSPTTEEFVSRWTDLLLKTRLAYSYDTYSVWSQDSELGKAPTGSLSSDELSDDYQGDLIDANSLSRILHPSFSNEPQGPRQMSSGFHQIFPIIVQVALMRQREVLAIENPEVHLHPRLQLQLAEFLMHQANSGKWIVIETHSDLIIRRVMREILEESIGVGQAKIRIFFSDLQKAEAGYHYSTLHSLKIDEHSGRISNWPRGFLDDDLDESRRLLDIMYGEPPSELDETE